MSKQNNEGHDTDSSYGKREDDEDKTILRVAFFSSQGQKSRDPEGSLQHPVPPFGRSLIRTAQTQRYNYSSLKIAEIGAYNDYFHLFEDYSSSIQLFETTLYKICYIRQVKG